MEGRRCLGVSSLLAAAFLLLQLGPISGAQRSKPSQWKTLRGDSPVVIAKGGFSGLFPDSSEYAYTLATSYSPDTILWCDVQLTKDGVGICLPKLNLENCTNINNIFPSRKSTYNVNGVRTSGWYSVDYSKKELSQVYLTQGVYSRTPNFDEFFPILAVEDVVAKSSPPALWLNIENDIFYTQHKLSLRSYTLSIAKRVILNYVSSPEVGFLHSIAPRFAKTKTKLIFRFLDEDIIEPSTNQTYGSLLKNLTFIKTFASGILVPKEYIWPISSDNYLLPYTSIVKDAHKEELEIYAADFANDVPFSYNYSYDPVVEYLNFIDNGAFSVDGVLSDFPITPSEAIGCFSEFSHINKNITGNGKPIIFSHCGTSGMYPGCTDLAYKQAVIDGADFIDCPVQVTKDGNIICMSSINLVDDTTVTKSPFSSRSSTIPKLQSTSGTFTFNLTWEDIQDLQPLISSPEFTYGNLIRNPRHTNDGHFMKLSDFLAFAKGKALSGILISIENAAFMAEELGFSVTDSVISALNAAGYSNQTAQEVMIESTDSSVLVKFKQLTKYKLLYKIHGSFGDAVASSITDIKRFSDAVVIPKNDIYPTSQGFITGQTNLVQKLQKANLSVYVYGLRNEFVSQPWDFFADAVVEINAYAKGAKVDGIFSDFPGTVANYRRNSCSKLGNNMPKYMLPVRGGGLVDLLSGSGAEPPVLSPMPSLKPSDVVEPPLPPASLKPSTLPTHSPTPPSSQPSSGPPLIHPTSIIFFLISLLL